MPEFVWRAADASGKVQEGRLEAASPALVQKQLRGRGLTPLNVREAGADDGPATPAGPGLAGLVASPKKQQVGRGPVNQADILLLTSELSIMLRAGLALDNALRVLFGMSHKPSVAELTRSTLADVKGGTPFSKALAKVGIRRFHTITPKEVYSTQSIMNILR